MEQNLSRETRTESDLIGSREVPADALYGVQTLRGIENFRISKFHLNEYPLFINALAITKMGAAVANYELCLLTKEQVDAILKACKEILEGEHHEQFPVDMIQGGAGTTTNMNANEVIANRALELMGHQRGEYQYCSPNDHVNRSQSTNDAYPTAIHLGMYYTHLKLVKHFSELIEAFQKKATLFAHIIKMGRTQLEDAVPMTLGQTFNGFASILRDEIKNLDFAAQDFLTVNMGATAIGTGITAEPEYAEKCELIRRFYPAPALTTDVIVGFPMETEEDFEDSYEFVKNIHFYETHIFKYSRRQGTKAAAMDGQLTEAVKAQRSEKMLKLHEIRAKEYETSMIGRTLELLLEEEVEIGGKTYFMAHSKEYVRAVIEKTDAHKVNDLVKAKAVDFADEHVLLAICEDLY